LVPPRQAVGAPRSFLRLLLLFSLSGVASCTGGTHPARGGAPEVPSLAYDPSPALEYILKHQNEDGTWFIGMQVNPDTGGGITVGTTALTAMALLDYIDHDPSAIKPVIDRSVEGCLKYVWKRKESVAKAFGKGTDFDSINWGQIYTLQLLGRLMQHPRWESKREAFRKELQDLLPWFYQRQHPNGGWGYNGTFQTAAALIMLHELKEAGIPVNEETNGKVVALLKANRSGFGYDYNVGPASSKEHSPGDLEELRNGSAARDGACDYALYLHGAITREEMEEMLQGVMDHRQFMWKMRALTAEGQWPRVRSASPSAYFPFWGYCHTAIAVDACSEGRRAAWGKLLYEDLLQEQEADGTWINLPITASKHSLPVVEYTEEGARVWRQYEQNIGPGSKLYATTMALMALKHIL
jgi:hypothetical protein